MKKWSVILATLAAAIGGGAWHTFASNSAASPVWRQAAVERGDLEKLVSGTGTLSAMGTVEVGTQVSGAVDRIYVDFNDRVQAGQLLALLDTANLAAAVRDAEASLAKASAQYQNAAADYERNQRLFDNGFISAKEIGALEAAAVSAGASVVSAEAVVDRARVNRSHAEIRAPITGTVLQRNIEAGQTVAASLSAPTLFVIAEDLARMEILAQIDESDVGRVNVGQPVSFTVTAYPDAGFTGTVAQIRLQPQTVQNVVLYTVVVDAPNADGRLLPGMTATVDFVVDRAADALLVPNASLSFQPAAAGAVMRERDDTARSTRGASSPTEQPEGMSRGRVWYIDGTGALRMARVTLGLTNGIYTVLVDAGSLSAGAQVITGVQSTDGATASRPAASAFPSPGGRSMRRMM